MMTFEVRSFVETDYAMYRRWLSSRGRIAVPYKSLPTHGVMVECNNTPVCAGFIYQMDSPICSIGSMASDIGQNKDIRSAAVEKMIDHLIIDAKELGYTMTVVTTDKNKLLDRLYKRGFEKFDENLVQVGRAL